MELRTSRNCHSLYNLEYHLILVTKYRKNVINEDVFNAIKEQTEKVVSLTNGIVEEINYEPDHVHVLLSLTPQTCVSQLINSIKTTTARRVRKEYADYISQYYLKPYFWSRSCMILSSGGAPIEVIQQYVREQGTLGHAAKKRHRRS